jgi:hypothetical protein
MIKKSSDRIEYFDEQGKLHNDDGPAFIYTTGHMYWYYHGERLTKCCTVGYAPDTNGEIRGDRIGDSLFYRKECAIELVEKHQKIFERMVRLKAFW